MNLLLPTFEVQQTLRRRTLGERAWEALSKRLVPAELKEKTVFESLDKMKTRNV